MPRSNLLIYQEEDGTVPLLDWLGKLPRKAQDKCRVKLGRLAELGYDLRRPEADILRDGIYELRVGLSGINYRMLYFFHGKQAVVATQGLKKENRVPDKEIDLALIRKSRFELQPTQHTFVLE